MRRLASFVALALLLVSAFAPLVAACPCREAEPPAPHSCCEETVVRPLTPDCCAVVAAAVPATPMTAPSSPPAVAIAWTPAVGLPAGETLASAPRPSLRSFSPPPTVLRL